MKENSDKKVVRCTNCNKKLLVNNPKDYICDGCGYSPEMAEDFDAAKQISGY